MPTSVGTHILLPQMWFILFFIFSTYPPPPEKLRVSFFIPPLTPIPAMLTAQACNRIRCFCRVVISASPWTTLHRRGKGAKYRLTLSFSGGWRYLEYNLDLPRLHLEYNLDFFRMNSFMRERLLSSATTRFRCFISASEARIELIIHAIQACMAF